MTTPDRYRPFLEAHPVLSLIGRTPLVRVEVAGIPEGVEILAKAEWMNPGASVKDRPVMAMILEAVLSGELQPGRTILDSSSGNAGIAYAMVGAALGYAVEIVVPGNASVERTKRMLAHGATVVETDPVEGYDAALGEAHRRAAAEPDRYWMCDQYANEHNWRAHYEATAAEILEQTGGRLTHFVAGIGTGGTITGTGRRVKEHDPHIDVVCVVPERFPGIEGLKPLGEPQDIVPAILDETVIDRRVEVTTDDAALGCAELAKTGLFVGQSSGAYLHAALQVAQDAPAGSRIVTIFSDLGERYFSTGLWGS